MKEIKDVDRLTRGVVCNITYVDESTILCNNNTNNSLDKTFEIYSPVENSKDIEIKKLCNMVGNEDCYKAGDYECKEVMRELLKRKNSWYEAIQFSNIFKYIWRYDVKNGVEDLKTARDYLNGLINYLEENNQN